MHSIFQDLRFALRVIRKRPAASTVIVLTLALGIGANATFFAAYYGMVQRPLPFAEPEELVALFESQPALGETWNPVSAPNLTDWREDRRAFDGMAAYQWTHFNLQSADEPERLSGSAVEAELFPLLGVEPLLGRNFLPEEDTPDARRVVLIGHDVWTRRFGGEPAIVGQTLRLDDTTHEIVGVMPPGFRFPNVGQIWTPLALDPDTEQRDARTLDVIARLGDGVTTEQAQAAMAALGGRLAAQHPETNRGWSVQVRELHDAWLPPVTQLASTAQQILVCGVLLIVCANVANLILAQATVRRQETALRAALGADRGRLVRQALAESTLLALTGGAIGTLLAAWGETWMTSLATVPIPYWLSFRLDGFVLAYTLGVTLLTGVLIGLLPALRSSGRELFESLKAGGRTEDRSGGLLRQGLVAAEYAVALVILVAGLLMVKSFDKVRNAEHGFDPKRVLTLRVSMGGSAYETPQARSMLLGELLQRLRGLPEVAAAGAVDHLPISRFGYMPAALAAQGHDFPAGEEPRVTLQHSSDGYLPALGIPRLAGRSFTAGEVRDGAEVALLSLSLAERLWPGEEPLGRRVRADPQGPWLEVVGIVGDVEPGHMIAGAGSYPEHQVYVPMAQASAQLESPPRTPTLALKSRGEPTALTAAVRHELARLAPGVPMFQVLTMDEQLTQFYFAQRLWSQMFSAIATLALLIAAVGAYGVTAYSVSRRTREMGIRVALGASRFRLLALVVRQGLLLTAVGVGLGLLGALPLAGAMQRLLHDMSAFDPAVFAAVAGMLLTVGFLASYLPARRAAGVDPIVTLREE